MLKNRLVPFALLLITFAFISGCQSAPVVMEELPVVDPALSPEGMSAEEAATLANMNQLNAMGYQMLNEKENDLAIKFFKMNVKNNPKNANVYDSLGEGYKTLGDNKNAIKNLKKSLSLNPPPNVKANSEKLLKELGVVI